MVKGYREQEKAEWVTNLSHLLRERGFYHTVHYVSDRQGNTIHSHNGKSYTVMKAIQGREANNSSLYDVKRSATALARFHQAAQGFPAPEGISTFKPSILEKWEVRLGQFEKILEKVNNQQQQNRFVHTIRAMA
ncbi:MAG: serine kinase, partial [Clostridia bacterium]